MNDDQALRPRSFDDYVGQADLKARLKVHIASALARRGPLEHMLFIGPPGVGKTSLAAIIAGALTDPITVLSKPVSDERLLARLHECRSGILFIDEIHAWSRAGQETLTTLVEDRAMETRFGRENFWALTVLAATTERGGVIKPLHDRFAIRPEWKPYTDAEMGHIVRSMGDRAGVEIDAESAVALGRATAGIPRHAKSLVLSARDLYLANDRVPTVAEILDFCEVAPDGLDVLHLRYLRLLGDMGGVAGMEMMGTRLRVNHSAVAEIERLLFDRRFIGLQPRGRTLTGDGRRRLAGSTTTARPSRLAG